MGKARVLILGHSFIRRLHAFITRSHDNEYTTKLGILTPDFICKWHGVGGRTVAKVLKYDLSVVKEFGPDIIILQLGTNDLPSGQFLSTYSGFLPGTLSHRIARRLQGGPNLCLPNPPPFLFRRFI